MPKLSQALIRGTALAIAFLISPVSGQTSDPAIGTWELNLAKSTFHPGPPPNSTSRTYSVVADGVKMSADLVNAEGKRSHVEYTAKFDGNDYPFVGSQTIDTISLKRIDEFTTRWTLKKAGKVVGTGKREVSKDGKTMVAASKNAKGEASGDVLVFDRRETR